MRTSILATFQGIAGFDPAGYNRRGSEWWGRVGFPFAQFPHKPEGLPEQIDSEWQSKAMKMSNQDPSELATPCGLYCGSCRYFIAKECAGCGSPDREGCTLFECCRGKHELQFCAECTDFPCDQLNKSIGLHPDWLMDQAKIALPNTRN